MKLVYVYDTDPYVSKLLLAALEQLNIKGAYFGSRRHLELALIRHSPDGLISSEALQSSIKRGKDSIKVIQVSRLGGKGATGSGAIILGNGSGGPRSVIDALAVAIGEELEEA